MNPAKLFEANLTLIERVIGVVCRRSRIFGADAEDFASTTRLALIENDYAILRKYEGRSSLATFLGVVVQRLFSIRGRKRPADGMPRAKRSASAKRVCCWSRRSAVTTVHSMRRYLCFSASIPC
jgi:hypothetical protein